MLYNIRICAIFVWIVILNKGTIQIFAICSASGILILSGRNILRSYRLIARVFFNIGPSCTAVNGSLKFNFRPFFRSICSGTHSVFVVAIIPDFRNENIGCGWLPFYVNLFIVLGVREYKTIGSIFFIFKSSCKNLVIIYDCACRIYAYRTFYSVVSGSGSPGDRITLLHFFNIGTVELHRMHNAILVRYLKSLNLIADIRRHGVCNSLSFCNNIGTGTENITSVSKLLIVVTIRSNLNITVRTSSGCVAVPDLLAVEYVGVH